MRVDNSIRDKLIIICLKKNKILEFNALLRIQTQLEWSV